MEILSIEHRSPPLSEKTFVLILLKFWPVYQKWRVPTWPGGPGVPA